MSFSWKKYFKLAEELNKNTEESYKRSAISRAYYSVYNLIRIRVNYSGRGQIDSSHKRLIENLKMPSDVYIINLDLDEEDIQMIADELDFLRNERNRADYNGTEAIDNRTSTRSIERAKSILSLLYPDEYSSI